MSMEEFERLLYDTYQMDAYLPPLFRKWKTDYENVSYSLWAIDELKSFIAKKLGIRAYGSVDEFCEWTHEFAKNMRHYSQISSKTSHIFRIAGNMAENILELLRAMK